MPKIPITPPYRGTDELAPGSGGVELIDGYCDPLPEGGYALFRRGGLWMWWLSGLQNPIDGLYWWEEQQCLLASCEGRVFVFWNMVDAPTEITTPSCRINFGSPTVFASSGKWLCITSRASVPIIWNGSGSAKYLAVYPPDVAVAGGTAVEVPRCDSVCFTNSNFLLDETGANRVRLAYSPVDETTEPGFRLALNITPDSSPDRLVRVDARYGEVTLMGSRSVEFWAYDAGKDTAETPFSRVSGFFSEYGIGAPYSLAFFNGSHIWLDGNKRVVMLSNRTVDVISQGFDRVLRAMTRIDDAFGFIIDSRFYCLSFPTDDFTLVYDFVTRAWQKWSFWNAPNYERFLGNCAAWSPQWNTQFVGSRKEGRVLIYSRNLVTDQLGPIRMLYRTAHLDWGTLDWKQSERLILRLRRGM